LGVVPLIRVGSVTLAIGFDWSTENLKFLQSPFRNFRFGNSAFRGGARTLAARFVRSTGFLKFLSTFSGRRSSLFSFVQHHLVGRGAEISGTPKSHKKNFKKK